MLTSQGQSEESSSRENVPTAVSGPRSLLYSIGDKRKLQTKGSVILTVSSRATVKHPVQAGTASIQDNNVARVGGIRESYGGVSRTKTHYIHR